MLPVKGCKRIVVMLVLLAFAGQSLAFMTSFCRMTDQSPVASMAGGEDVSIHALHGHDRGHGEVDVAAASDTSDCCAKGDGGCTMSGCVSIAMMPAPQQIALPFVRVQPLIHSLASAPGQHPSSLYRPPISR